MIPIHLPMKNLNLENLGVQELNQQELTETNGGIWPIIVGFVVAAWCADSIFNMGGTSKNYQKGWDSVK